MEAGLQELGDTTVQFQAESGRLQQEQPTCVAGFTAERPLPVIFPHVLNAVSM